MPRREAGVASSPARPLCLSDVRVLIVEDHEDSRDALRQMLEWLGARVSTARNGREGLESALLQPPHLVLCDLRMPGMDGLTFSRLLRDAAPDGRVRLVAITGDCDVGRTAAAGFVGHLVKPIDYEQLVATVGQVLGLPAG
jgi:CheY-like chemotaxis protein